MGSTYREHWSQTVVLPRRLECGSATLRSVQGCGNISPAPCTASPTLVEPTAAEIL
jgi:hypothetical protein